MASEGVIFSAFDIPYQLYALLYLGWSLHHFLFRSLEFYSLIISVLKFLWVKCFPTVKISF